MVQPTITAGTGLSLTNGVMAVQANSIGATQLKTAARQTSLSVGDPSLSVSSTLNYLKVGAWGTGTTVENDNKVPCAASTLKRFAMRIGPAVTAGHTLTCTVRLNGADTGLTLAFTNADGANAEKSISADVAVAEGDDLTVSVVKDTAGAQVFVFRGRVDAIRADGVA